MATIRQAVRKALRDSTLGRYDRTYRRPHRRQACYGEFIMPSFHQPRPRPGFLIDTSASMQDTQLARAVAELGGLTRQLGYTTEVIVACCDTVRARREKGLQLCAAGAIWWRRHGSDRRPQLVRRAECHRPSRDRQRLPDGLAGRSSTLSGHHDPRRRRIAAAMGQSRREQGDHHRRTVNPGGAAVAGSACRLAPEVNVAGWSMPEMSPWKPPSLTFPPNSARMWIRFAVWQLWMGMFICVALAFGIRLIVTAPDRLYVVRDFSNCYVPPAPSPCERIAYQGGGLNVIFTALIGALLLGVGSVAAVGAVERGRAEADHRRFPATAQRLVRARLAQSVHVAVATCALGLWFHHRRRDSLGHFGLMLWTLVASATAKPPTVHIDTSQSFRVDQ